MIASRGTGGSVLAVAGLLMTAAPVAAHPHHTSVSEAELNPKTGHLEVSLGVSAPDLLRALMAADGRAAKWTDSDLSARVAKYLTPRFQVTTARGPARLRLVGWAPERQRVWLHFELLDVKRLHGARVANTVLMEIEPGQLNTVRVRSGGFRRSMVFDRVRREHRIDTHEAAARR